MSQSSSDSAMDDMRDPEVAAAMRNEEVMTTTNPTEGAKSEMLAREALAVRVSHMSKWFTDQSYEATTLREVVTALRSQPAPAQREGAPVAYRWRQPGNKHWIYDPTPEWIEDYKHEIELEALYAAPVPQSEALGEVVRKVLGPFYKTVDVMKSAYLSPTHTMSVWADDMTAIEDVMMLLEKMRDASISHKTPSEGNT